MSQLLNSDAKHDNIINVVRNTTKQTREGKWKVNYYINGEQVNKFKLDMVLYEAIEELHTESFDDMLDELHGEIHILGIKYDASFLLKQSDPIAYEIAQQEYIGTIFEEQMEEFQKYDKLIFGDYVLELK